MPPITEWLSAKTMKTVSSLEGPLRPYPPPIQNGDWKATWSRGVLENTPGDRHGLRRILRSGGSANKMMKSKGFTARNAS